MNISEPFIRRPVATTLIMACLLVFGGLAYRQLPVSDLPSVDFPTIQVSATLPGASPDTMASSVATPLEREFSTIAGIDSMVSTSQQSTTQITITFDLARDIDAASQDVQAAISRAQGRLPRDMPSPPSVRKVNPADQPILFLAITSETLPLPLLNEFADTVLAQRIGTLPGVAQVVIFGSQKYAVRIQLDPRALASKGIGLDEVARRIQERNVNLPKGVMSGPDVAPMLEASGQLMDAEAYRDEIVAWREGSPLRLSQIATVIDSVENDRTAAWFQERGRPPTRAIVLAVQRQPGANTVAVADSVHAALASVQLPASVRVVVLNDRSEPIRASVDEVKFTLLLTLGLVTGTIFIFLRTLRATAIPAVAMPLSIVGTFAVMWWLGFSVDNLSLMALTLCVGFVVDDAIVMLENIVRHVEMGKPPFRAALDGSREIGFTIVSMTVSLVAVFIPVLFMGGIVGRLLREFSIVIAVAILISGVVSLTLTPMMCARWLTPGHPEADRGTGAISRTIEAGFDGMLALYRWLLDLALRWPGTVLLGSAGVLVATVFMFMAIPKGFLPNEDQNRIFVPSEAAEGTSFAAMTRYQQALAEQAAKHPEVLSFMSSIGSRGGSAAGTNVGTMFLRLRPLPERTKSADEVVRELRAMFGSVPGVRAFPQVPPTIRIGGQLTRSLYQFTLESPDKDALEQAAPQLFEAMRDSGLLADLAIDLQRSNPQVRLEIDREKAASLRVTPEQVEQALWIAFGTRQVSTIYAPQDTYQVIAEVAPEFQTDPSWLDSIFIRSAEGDLVPITAVADMVETAGAQSVNHSGQLPAVTISFNLAQGVSLGTAVDRVRELAQEILPPTITTSFQGAAQAFERSLAGLGWLLLLAVLVTYVVLGILYESFLHPLTILSALPFAGFGALATLLLFDAELSLYGFVGVILLVGLVKKNGIMMVDFAIVRRRAGATAREAIRDACLVRFRPIMMTTLSALLGTLPLALGWGPGAEARRPLGLAVVGGLLFSQFVTLIATPIFYLVFEWIADRMRRPAAEERAHAVDAPAGAVGAVP